MPFYLQEVLEPNAPSLEERLEGVKMCQERRIYAQAILAQPIIPVYLNKSSVDLFLQAMKKANIKNIKPEFLTTNFENLSIITQYINHFDPQLVGPLLNLYLEPENRNHIKQRCRTAPSREWSARNLIMIQERAKEYGISTSICNWVSSETKIPRALTEHSTENGFRCLGYQQGMFTNGNNR
jgi:DNA repair photolyase